MFKHEKDLQDFKNDIEYTLSLVNVMTEMCRNDYTPPRCENFCDINHLCRKKKWWKDQLWEEYVADMEDEWNE